VEVPMKRATVALWGYGRIGRSIIKILKNRDYSLRWLRDCNRIKCSDIPMTLSGCEILNLKPEPENHPLVNIVIDATGDKNLLPYWRKALEAKRMEYVILTRRDSDADLQVMVGLPNSTPAPLYGGITAVGSCTGNALVPFLSRLSVEFPFESVFCRVLHPLKQDKVFELRSIETALKLSVFDHEPSIASYTTAQSMEIPVERGMALDLSITFKNEIPKKELNKWFMKSAVDNDSFSLSHQPCTSASIVGNYSSAVLDSTWSLDNRNFRGLLWQDNEFGFSARVVDVLGYSKYGFQKNVPKKYVQI
jgi:glyceraldehyde-3-phosphate dehydrogenase (NAD(P)+) (phosphorylating)